MRDSILTTNPSIGSCVCIIRQEIVKNIPEDCLRITRFRNYKINCNLTEDIYLECKLKNLSSKVVTIKTVDTADTISINKLF